MTPRAAIDDVIRANRETNATLSCPACGTSPGVDCEPGCPLFQLSREFEVCDDCGADLRLCDCFMRYDPSLPPHSACEARGCAGCGGTGRVQPAARALP